MIKKVLYPTAAGDLLVTLDHDEIISANYNASTGKEERIGTCDYPIRFQGTLFQIKVWEATMTIPKGETRTYQQIADMIGRSSAVRAVANALGQNKIAYFVPCHRVLRKNGALGGYFWGIERKKKLLAFEKS